MNTDELAEAFMETEPDAPRVKRKRRSKLTAVRHRNRDKNVNHELRNFRRGRVERFCRIHFQHMLHKTKKSGLREIAPFISNRAKVAIAILADRLTRHLVERSLVMTQASRRATAKPRDLDYILRYDFNMQHYNSEE